MQDRIEVKIL